jgi:hypothetical protein
MAGYSTLVSEITQRLGNRSDIAARVPLWLNDAYYEVLLSPRFAFFELDQSGTVTTADGTRIYSLADITDLWFILSVRDTTNSQRLRRAHVREFDDIQYTEGQPNRYARYGNNLELDPTPDGVYTLAIRYRKRPSELADGGSPVIGREWDEVLIALAVLKGREALEQTEQAAGQRQLVEGMLARREEVLVLEDADAEVTMGPDLMGGW